MKLKILSWNLSYAYGLGSEGTAQYRQRSPQHFVDSLEAMSAFMKSLDIDIALLQEVDFDASRSNHLKQLDILSRKSGLLYRDALVSWNSAYVPYPGLNPKNQFRKVVSGGGILSRYPIRVIQNDLLPKPKENSKLYNHFYLNRYFQIASVELPHRELKVCNLHLEAFSQDNRELHLVKLQDRLQDYAIDLAAGDFNGPFTLAPELNNRWSALQPTEPTYPSPQPEQFLDGAIVKREFGDVTIQTLNTGTLSDHFAVLITVSV